MDKMKNRRRNLLYKLRRKGIRCDSRTHIIEYPYGEDPRQVPQIRSIIDEFNFNIQFIIT